MVIPCSRNDREINKFVECPTDSGDVAVRTKICQDTGETLNVSINSPDTPKIYNLSAPTARTEVSHVLSTNTKQLIVRVRGVANLQLAFISGESSTNYITIPSGASLSLTDLKTSVTLYLQTDKNSQVIEILEWT